MKKILLFNAFCIVLWGQITPESIKIISSKEKLRIFIPTQAKMQVSKNFEGINLQIKEPFLGEAITKPLIPPFHSLQISPLNEQTQIILKAQNSLITFSYTQGKDGLSLIFSQSIQWWRYGLVIAILLGLILILLYLKKKQKLKPKHTFKMTEHPINKNCKIIILDHTDKTFMIFSNEKGCTLLDSQAKVSKED